MDLSYNFLDRLLGNPEPLWSRKQPHVRRALRSVKKTLEGYGREINSWVACVELAERWLDNPAAIGCAGFDEANAARSATKRLIYQYGHSRGWSIGYAVSELAMVTDADSEVSAASRAQAVEALCDRLKL